MTARLFVYGTLMASFDSGMAVFLRQKAKFLGEGLVSGFLLDLGSYPALVVDGANKGIVKGHVFEFPVSSSILETLDAYEGIDPSRPSDAEYARISRQVKTPEGEIECWMYVYRGEQGKFTVIPSGFYPDYVPHNPAHQRFMKIK